MAESSKTSRWRSNFRPRRSGLREEDLINANEYLYEALSANKRDGLRLAVRARWVALAIIAMLIPYLNFTWEALYYEALLVGFALIGWAQLRVGRVAQSRQELLLIFCDLALMTFVIVVPNPFHHEIWPTAFQYEFAGFSYFYVLLASATMAYSWRTVVAFGTWTTGLWLGALTLVVLFGTEIPELSQKMAVALTGYDRMLAFLDPNNPQIPIRVQEIVVFLIVAGILALNGNRTNRLIIRQAEVARERANLARHFPPNIVDQMAKRHQPLGDVRSQVVAVMFVDIVGFTRIAERQSAADVVALLREFHGRMENAVFNQHGTLDKFLGDGLMATFGTPDPGAHDASNALRCARTMLADIDQWNSERMAAGAEEIAISIGLHYGMVVLGDIGSARRLEYAVLGDTVNVASRLEQLTRSLGVRMAMSDDLAKAIHDEPADDVDTLLSGLGNVGAQTVRGRDEPIVVWTL
ncbi:MAG: adenylate/guanylate cyclase domain-containing protein [Proteobacteria bacterium]|nr:adenylate/guanylate cyclase domain-containing protein [Pseudomonadota bacterium]